MPTLLVLLLACADVPPERVDLDDGYYLLVVPDSWRAADTAPAMVHLHGHGGNPEKYLNDKELLRDLADGGVIAAFPAGEQNDWKIGLHVDEIARNDRKFLASVADDLREQFDLSSVVLSGHSNGASMVYDVACAGDGTFDAYQAISGGFWDPLPGNCTGPARPHRALHGTEDDIWPPDGRPIRTVHQVGPEPSVTHLRDVWGCTEPPVSVPTADGLTCTNWAACDTSLCWHDGAHKLPTDWGRWAADWAADPTTP
ncbi:MAG: polyhydroxybutyrate depolymerase [Myxococcota bacterium]|jgi:polyhydroxybutyrate depolymerase